MNMKRILSALLVTVMVFGAVAGFIPAPSTTRVLAAEAETGDYLELALKTSYEDIEDRLNGTPLLDANGNIVYDSNNKQVIVGAMTPMLEREVDGYKYRIYASATTGEVIYTKEKDGKIIESLASNPYDMGGNEDIADTVKRRLLSQIEISYKGTDGNLKTMDSFTEAAERGQIKVKTIKNGIRVQYTIGRENATYKIPGGITAAKFEEKIMAPLKAFVAACEAEVKAATDSKTKRELQEKLELAKFYQGKVFNSYTLIDVTKYSTDSTYDKMMRQLYQTQFPITAEIDPLTGKYYVIYVQSDGLAEKQKAYLESLVNQYCPDYTYQDVEEDNAETKYVQKQEVQPLFKLSLEYTINADGTLDVRLPANGILYDATTFQLESISTLNYMGAGSMSEDTYGNYLSVLDIPGTYDGNSPTESVKDGYIFYPDGSGAIFNFSDLYTADKKVSVAWNSKVYGQDYAYYTITGQSQEQIRMPVYGVVRTERVEIVDTGEKNENGVEKKKIVPVRAGYLAILEEGEALTSLSVSFGADRHNYASVYPTYLPRPKDTYDLADSVSVSGNTEWTVVADRQYTGNYRTRFILLSDAEGSKYDTTWVGMAKAYQDYLEGTGVISRIETADDQIPLYLEAFGSYETTKQILSMPVDVKVPLTTFEDVGTIYTDLSENAGISNINFKLTGFANGGLNATYPAKLKWEKAVGGKSGFRDLISMAEDKGFGVYPEFEFSYISNQGSFDGVSLKGLGARTVDNRYCSKQIYDAVYQQFTSYFDMCVATNLIATYYDKFSAKLSGYQEDGSFGLSVGTLGSDLNSNFDEDNPINREEAKEDIVRLLAEIKETYGSVMVNGGNSYSIGYADHILNMPLSGSNYRYASASVPFMAMVLHGYVNYTGAALNMSGDTDYNVLKAIESGAYPYYLLSYNTENTMLLKKDENLNKYYSIRYDIWRWEDPLTQTGDGMIVDQYNRLNAALADLQTAVMVEHSFLRAERALLDSELVAQQEDFKETVLNAVSAAIKAEKASLLSGMALNLKLYPILENAEVTLSDGTTQSLNDRIIAIMASDKTDEEKQKDIKLALESGKELASQTVAVPEHWKDIRALNLGDTEKSLYLKLFDAYSVEGASVEDFNTGRGFYTKANVDMDLLWASVVAQADGLAKKLTAEELAEFKLELEALVATASDNTTVSLYANVKALLGRTPTAEEIDAINMLILSGADLTNADVQTRIATIFGLTDDTKKTAMIGYIAGARDQKVVIAVVGDVQANFDFNSTDSSALAGTDYASTDYTLNDERLVLVTYEKKDGTLVNFILNYNIFDVEVKLNGTTYPIESYNYITITGALQ